MPNTSAPFGLRPVRMVDGSPYNASLVMCFVPASDGTALYIGDPVVFAGTASSDGYPTITIATAAGGAYVSGVVVGFIPNPSFTTLHRAASTARYVLVEVGERVVYEIQEDAVGGALAITAVQGNADLVAGSGSTVTGLSGWQLDSSTANTTNTLQLRVQGFVNAVDNDIGSAYARVLVTLNLTSNRNLTGV